jgi:RNA polymerase sigma factor (sigma-70 family)
MEPDPSARLDPGTADGDAALLAAIGAGDESAFGRLYDAWFDRAYDVAFRIVRERDAAADVAQDAFLGAWRNLDDLQDGQAFGGWLLRITRNRALDHKRKHDRTSPVDDETMALIEITGPGGGPEDRLAAATDPARAVEDAELVALVWEAAEALGDRDASLLDLHLRHGLSPAEIAEDLGVKANAAHQSLHRMRNRLADAVAARVLWRGGMPTCPDLADALEAAGGPAFGGDTAARVRRHAKSCDECAGRQRTHLKPSSLFAAVPIAVAPVLLRAKAAAAMEAAGVPMSGSRHRGPTDGDGPPPERGEPGRRRLVAGLVALVVLIASIVAVLALTTGSIDEEARIPAAETRADGGPDDPSSTTGPTASTIVPGSVGGAPDGAPADPEAPPQGESDSPTGPRIVSYSLSPTSVPTESTPPTIAWSVDPAGSGTAELTGPNLLSAALSGAQPVCPGVLTSGICVAAPGAYDYTLHAYDGAGDQVEVRTITLVVG